MAKEYPANEILWNSIVSEASAKYPVRKPNGGLSQPAAAYASKKYAQLGGLKVSSPDQVNPKLRDERKRAEDRAKRRDKRIERLKELNHSL